MNFAIDSTPEMVGQIYTRTRQRLQVIRHRLKRPLTLSEKILFGHLVNPESQDLSRGQSFLLLQPDRVAMQDATAQMALLQFMLSGRSSSAVPVTIHADHLIEAYQGAESDLNRARLENDEVYQFLSSAAHHYGIGFWGPGSGIIHQVVLEQYAFPGGLMIGTDSHTPNAGGLGMVAVGVGGADACDVMAGLPWEVKNPQIIGVYLKGQLKGWASPKDIVLKLLGMLTVKGGTDRIIEYVGPGARTLSATGKATICNMGAELGATASLFPFDEAMARYLEHTGRKELARLARDNRDILEPDSEVLSHPQEFYDQWIEIDLDQLEPQIAGPHSPDYVRGISQFKVEIQKNGWPTQISSVLVGSCTNSSYEDLTGAAHVLKQGLDHQLKVSVPFWISPGSIQIYRTIERDGILSTFLKSGATVLAAACGPCIGQWKRDDITVGQVNVIVTSFNRNFRGRNDGNPETLAFIASPEIVVALGLAGRLDFNPVTDPLPGTALYLQPPEKTELPQKGFVFDRSGYQAPAGSSVKVVVRPDSQRLQLLQPFNSWNPNDFENLVILAKIKGKCTTDHISPGGKWLKYRGHLDKISDNLLLGADNIFAPGRIGQGYNALTGEGPMELARIARDYKSRNVGWVIIGDENYGEGSSREHAAMTPRYLGCRAVIVKSFARIHETNLKKQGILALTFMNPNDYEKLQPNDRLTILGFHDLKPGQPVSIKVQHSDGSEEIILARHSYNQEQLQWFYAGSALNFIRQKLGVSS